MSSNFIPILILVAAAAIGQTSSLGNMSQPVAADRIRNEPESVWVEFIQLALDHKPLNLGQGFPDFAAPEYLVESLQNASREVLANQYTRSFGHPRLVKALQRYYSEFRSFNKHLVDGNKQILITVGAYEALFTAIMAFVNPGDQVVIIDPAFDAYAPIVQMAQGTTLYVPLELRGSSKDGPISSKDFELDMRELEAKLSDPKSKMLILNTPNNPLGKMYSKRELEEIGELCKRYNILVLADEVYEQMYYFEPHLSIAHLPGMFERTITVGSAGKTFSVTGWKIGWAFGPPEPIRYLQLVHQTAIYTVATPLQEAVARALEHEMELIEGTKSKSYWDDLRKDLKEKRDRMGDILVKANMRPIMPEGGYFMLVDFQPFAQRFEREFQLDKAGEKNSSNDYRFARWLSRSKGLQGIPGSAFYSPANKPLAANLIRFCFIKSSSTLDRLERLVANISGESNKFGGGGASQLGATRSKL